MDIFYSEEQKNAGKRQVLVRILNLLMQQGLLSEEENRCLKLLIYEGKSV